MPKGLHLGKSRVRPEVDAPFIRMDDQFITWNYVPRVVEISDRLMDNHLIFLWLMGHEFDLVMTTPNSQIWARADNLGGYRWGERKRA